MNKRSYGCHLKVCFFLSNEKMIELVDFILLHQSTSSRLHPELFILVFIQVVVCNVVLSTKLTTVVRGTIEPTIKAVKEW
jgi:hypothetical protein